MRHIKHNVRARAWQAPLEDNMRGTRCMEIMTTVHNTMVVLGGEYETTRECSQRSRVIRRHLVAVTTQERLEHRRSRFPHLLLRALLVIFQL